jgi:hypothetical protein
MPPEERSDTSLVIQPEGERGCDFVAQETIHFPADVLQTVAVDLFRPDRLVHLLHDEKHEDLHVWRILVARFARLNVLKKNLVRAECHHGSGNDKYFYVSDILKYSTDIFLLALGVYNRLHIYVDFASLAVTQVPE